jgi:hypothetical protein
MANSTVYLAAESWLEFNLDQGGDHAFVIQNLFAHAHSRIASAGG